MKTIFAKQISLLLGLTALGVVVNGLSAKAEMPDATATSATTALVVPDSNATVQIQPSSADQSVASQADAISTLESAVPVETSATTQLSSAESQADASFPKVSVVAEPFRSAESQANISLPQGQVTSSDTAEVTPPLPEEKTASAADLKIQPSVYQLPSTPPETQEIQVAQEDLDPGRATRSGRSYVGVGLNVGITGSSALGNGNFEIFSKIGLTETLSVRPSAIIGDNTVFLIPVTYDFNIQQADPFEPVRFAPYAGGGVLFSTGDNSSVGFLLTGGVDVPFSRQFVGTAALNVGFLESDTDVGLRLGVGYTF